MLRRFIQGIGLPLRGALLLLQHRRLLLLAVAPLLLTGGLYVITLILFVRYYDTGFDLLLDRPEAWYWLISYYVLRFLGFLLGVAVFVFSFVFVGWIIAAPFLEVLSTRTETLVRGTGDDAPFHLWQWAGTFLRSASHAAAMFLLLFVAFPLSFLPLVGQTAWLALGWLALVYEFTSFAMDRRRWSFRTKWRVLLADLAGALGFGAMLFVLLAVPLVGLVLLPVAAVAGTLFVLDREGQWPQP